jgi:class 3 adenylate cyclase
MTTPTHEVTLVFVDLVDSALMTRSMGDAEAYALICAHRALVREQLALHAGSEVERVGDGFVLLFPDVDHALDFALAVQRATSELRDRESRWPLRVRVGIHCGFALRDGAGFFGETVIRCARISAGATPDEILVSREVRERSRRHRDRLRQPRWVRLKGFERPELVFHALGPAS